MLQYLDSHFCQAVRLSRRNFLHLPKLLKCNTGVLSMFVLSGTPNQHQSRYGIPHVR